MLIVGTGASPAGLREGHQPRPGEIVGANAETVVVLQRERRVAGGSCEDWVVLRGASYQVEPEKPGACVTRGNGDELTRALDGRPGVAQLTARVMFSADPKADRPTKSPKELSQLQGDMRLAREKRDSLRPSPSSSMLPPPVQGNLVHVRSNMGQCLHRQFDTWQNGNPIHLWQCSEGAANMKTWVFDQQTGYVRSAANPGMCWHKARLDWTNGNPIHLWDCNEGRLEQKTWTYDQQSGLIRARFNPALCIHKRDSGFNNGNRVHLWACNAGHPDFKNWSLR